MASNIEKERILDDEKEAKRLRLRAAAVKELILTEIQYVSDLDLLQEIYSQPLSSSSIINLEQHRILFNNIPALYSLNRQFCIQLENRYKNWDPFKSCIASEFLQFAPYFSMYQSYLNTHERAAALVSRLYIRSSKFHKFIDNAQFNPKCNGLDLKSFLVKPLQRITKYTLLLKTIAKYTLYTHPDYNDLILAINKINSVNIKINEKMKTFDQRQAVRDVQARFTTNVDLVSPARYFIKEGKLNKICRKKDIQYVFILFSDLLIYGDTNTKNNKNNKNNKLKNTKNQIKIHQQIPINQSFKIRDIPQNIKYGSKCWEIHSPEKSFIVYADHPGLKQEWYRVMEKVVYERSTIESGKNRCAALWVPDDFTDHCMMPSCTHKFSVISRRHHCRYCGRLVCGPCSTHKLPHWKKTKKTVRACIMCYDEHKDIKNKLKQQKNVKNGYNKSKNVVPLVDEDSMSAGSDIDFEYWDSDDIDSNDDDDDNKDNKNSNSDDDNSTVNVNKYKRKSTKKLKKKHMKFIHARSASLGAASDIPNQQSNRAIFSHTSKIFRLTYEHTAKKSTQTIFELSGMSKRSSYNISPHAHDKTVSESLSFSQSQLFDHVLNVNNKPNSNSTNATNTNTISSLYSLSSTQSNPSPRVNNHIQTDNKFNNNNGNNNDLNASDKFSKLTASKSAIGSTMPGLPSIKIMSNLSTNLIKNGISISVPGTPTSSCKQSPSRRLRLVGTGMLNIEAHPHDHSLVSMRLKTFTEIIDWNLDPDSMKPKKKDDTSCYLKALNVLTQRNEILLIKINDKDIMDSLVTVLLSLSFYYEAENKDNNNNNNNDDDGSDSDDKQANGSYTVGLSSDNSISEHKAEIDRAIFLIENSKKHSNIKTIDVCKFLLAKKCPISVIQHAFNKVNVPIPDAVYELAGVQNPKDVILSPMGKKKKKYKNEPYVSSQKKKGRKSAKATYLLGTGFHRQSILKKKKLKKRKSNSQDFGDIDKYKNNKTIPPPLKQSSSSEMWLPPNIHLPDADHDLRYQNGLLQHDIRFCLKNKPIITQHTLPSDKLDQQLRPVINSMAKYSTSTLTKPASPNKANKPNVSLANYSKTSNYKKNKNRNRNKNKNKSRNSKKFSLFGHKK